MKRFMAILCVFLLLCSLNGLAAGAEEKTPYTLLTREELIEQLGERTLSDGKIDKLLNADLKTVRRSISTFEDYIAWIEKVNPQYYIVITSDLAGEITLEKNFSFNGVRQYLGSNIIADIARHVLGDDYPGMEVIFAQLKKGQNNYQMFANVIPVEGGYLVVGADAFAANALQNPTGQGTVDPMFVEKLDGVIDYFENEHLRAFDGSRLVQLMRMESPNQVILSLEKGLYIADPPGAVKILHQDRAAAFPKAGSAPGLMSYCVVLRDPEAVINDSETALAICEGTVDEAAAAINTLQDCLNYIYYSCFGMGVSDIEINFKDQAIWHFNHLPEAVFAQHKAGCGGTAGLVAHLLEGDYEEVGIINITYAEGFSGGHVINYIKKNNKYYVFDVNGWVVGRYTFMGMQPRQGDTLQEAALAWAKRAGPHVKAMVAYQHAAGGDIPIGWPVKGWGVSYLINGYGENVQILLEHRDEGYYYAFLDGDPWLLRTIDLHRSNW